MSMTSRSKPHAAHTYVYGSLVTIFCSPTPNSDQKPAADTADNDTGPTDYPRPAAPGEQPPHEHHPHEEEQPRRDKKHSTTDSERRVHEMQHKKADYTRPSKSTANKTGGMRIAQPAGRSIGL